jgi:Domain of unknown function (DUF4279)
MIETRDNEYSAYFTVTGDFDPAEISDRLGLEPTSCWRKGDRNEKTHLERKFSRWSLDSRLDKFAPLEGHVADVLQQLKPAVARVKTALETYEGGMQLVGWFYKNYPGLHFDKDLIAKLAECELSVDFDFYYMYSDAREDSR